MRKTKDSAAKEEADLEKSVRMLSFSSACCLFEQLDGYSRQAVHRDRLTFEDTYNSSQFTAAFGEHTHEADRAVFLLRES